SPPRRGGLRIRGRPGAPHRVGGQRGVRTPAGDAPLAVGSKVLVTRRLGPRALATTEEVTELNPPTTWVNRGIAGLPVIAVAKGRVAPLDDGTRSRVTITLTFEGHGIGKLLAPILARRQARQLPKDGQNLNQLLGRDAQAPTPNA